MECGSGELPLSMPQRQLRRAGGACAPQMESGSLRCRTPESAQPDQRAHFDFQRVHLAFVGLVVVAEGVQDAVKDEIAYLGGEGVFLLRGLALRLVDGDDDVAEGAAAFFGRVVV